MLLNRHQLHGVVARALDPGQRVVRELPVGTDAAVLLGHTDVGLVDHRRIRAALTKVIPVRPLKGRIRHPDLAAEGLGGHVHHAAGHVGGDALEGRPLPAHQELDELAVLQLVPAVEMDLPHAATDVLQGIFPLGPVIEVAGQPFPEDPAGLRSVKAKVAVAVGEVGEVPPLIQLPAPVVESVEMHPDLPRIGVQGRVLLHQQPEGVVNVYHGGTSSCVPWAESRDSLFIYMDSSMQCPECPQSRSRRTPL